MNGRVQSGVVGDEVRRWNRTKSGAAELDTKAARRLLCWLGCKTKETLSLNPPFSSARQQRERVKKMVKSAFKMAKDANA